MSERGVCGCVCVYVCVCHNIYVGRSEDNLGESVFSYCVDSGDELKSAGLAASPFTY